MSNFYIRNMIRGRYSRFANPGGSGSGSLSTVRTSDSLAYAMDTISNNLQQHEHTTPTPGSLPSRVSLGENRKDVGVGASFYDYRLLPNIEIAPKGKIIQ